MVEVWNESHIVWELFQTHFFHHVKPYMVVRNRGNLDALKKEIWVLKATSLFR